MSIVRLDNRLLFPDPNEADDSGILAVGGDASPERLLLAYHLGIFPWPHEFSPLLWFSPDPRFILELEDFHLGRSLRKNILKEAYTIRFDSQFNHVIEHCSKIPRPGQEGSWITQDLITGFKQLHTLGFAHSIEAYKDDRLVGGLYGVSLGHAFFGESMFALEPNASKVAFATLVAHLKRWRYDFVDCQVYTDHLARFGAYEILRTDFLKKLMHTLSHPTKQHCWNVTQTAKQVVDILTTP